MDQAIQVIERTAQRGAGKAEKVDQVAMPEMVKTLGQGMEAQEVSVGLPGSGRPRVALGARAAKEEVQV